jgi:hypothetical protein
VQAAQVAALQAQLTELVGERNEMEKKLLAGCAALLNEKKRKIRDLERVLAGAKVDGKKAAAVKASRSGHDEASAEATAHIPGSSRPGKRKPETHNPDPGSPTSSSDDAFEEAPPRGASPERDAESQEEDAAAAADDDDNETTDAESMREAKTIKGVDEMELTPDNGRPAAPVPAEPPPRRELPFATQRRSKVSEGVREEVRAGVGGGSGGGSGAGKKAAKADDETSDDEF